MRIGFVGLGSIGKQMARRLVDAGLNITVYSRGAGLADVLGAGAATRA